MSPHTALERIAAAQASRATQLDLSHCNLTEVPEEVFALDWLEVLILGEQTNPDAPHPHQNQIATLPIDFIFLKSLRGLGLNGNQLTAYPTVLTHLSSLETLILSGNPLTSLSNEVTNLTQLRTLGLEYCQLSDLPEELGDLTHLHTLGLSHNALDDLPDTFDRLKVLRKLGLAHNQFTAFPAMLLRMAQLEVINLAHNRIHYLPRAVAALPHLRQLKLMGNPLPKASIAAAERGFSALQHLYQGFELQRRATASAVVDTPLDPHERQLLKTSRLRLLQPHAVTCLLCDGKKTLSGRITLLQLQLQRETCFGCRGKGIVSDDATDLHRLLSRCIQHRLQLKEDLRTLLKEEEAYARKREQNKHTQVLYSSLAQSLEKTLQLKQQQIDDKLYQYRAYQRYEKKILQALYNHFVEHKIQQERAHQDAYDWRTPSSVPDLYLLAGDIERLLDEWEAILMQSAASTIRDADHQRLRELDQELHSL